MWDHYDDYLGGDDEDYGHDPYDYDYYGPNSDFHHSGYHGYGFPENDQSSSPLCPSEPEYKLADWKRDDPDNYDKIMAVLVAWALRRNKRLLKSYGESAGPEKIMQACEADLDAGWCKLMNASIEGIVRTCVYEFNDSNGQYDLSEDN